MMSTNPVQLYGLILTGGRSTRMGRDKATLRYGGVHAIDRTAMLLSQILPGRTHVSIRADQAADAARTRYPVIVDQHTGAGPIAGIFAAQAAFPHAAWLVVACDMPFLDAYALQYLIGARDPERLATAYRSTFDGMPEPLCAIYEPQSGLGIKACLDSRRHCPRKFLIHCDAALVELPHHDTLANINSPDEYAICARDPRVSPPPGAASPEPSSPDDDSGTHFDVFPTDHQLY